MTFPPSEEKSSKPEDKQDTSMLEVWLNEPEDIVSATDVWSLERAITKPRHTGDNTVPQRSKDKGGDVAEAA
ncbi:uncharacterized protein FTOL_08355 [Fusarium torulosum]|uniref:Uncharacterized protein n=1 Tax=Fusarium torulosum TaxID=33205 RepID=A0AAE8MCG9_9HYPO|nr:uncharacterized protein FTOL_08355 [Fusarium torulosum]